MSDNDGYNIVASRIRRQMMVKEPELSPERMCFYCGETSLIGDGHKCLSSYLDAISLIMVTCGLSVSDAIRYYTNMFGLPKGF